MIADTVFLTFSGYWTKENIFDIPQVSGIYCVHSCIPFGVGSATLSRILYIGQSKNVGRRIISHERFLDWEVELVGNEFLCFSFAPFVATKMYKNGVTDMDETEAALINFHKPKLNDEFKYSFPYRKTRIITSGERGLLASNFTVLSTFEQYVRNMPVAMGSWNYSAH
jgi:hypothetical protein